MFKNSDLTPPATDHASIPTPFLARYIVCISSSYFLKIEEVIIYMLSVCKIVEWMCNDLITVVLKIGRVLRGYCKKRWLV